MTSDSSRSTMRPSIPHARRTTASAIASCTTSPRRPLGMHQHGERNAGAWIVSCRDVVGPKSTLRHHTSLPHGDRSHFYATDGDDSMLGIQRVQQKSVGLSHAVLASSPPLAAKRSKAHRVRRRCYPDINTGGCHRRLFVKWWRASAVEYARCDDGESVCLPFRAAFPFLQCLYCSPYRGEHG